MIPLKKWFHVHEVGKAPKVNFLGELPPKKMFPKEGSRNSLELLGAGSHPLLWPPGSYYVPHLSPVFFYHGRELGTSLFFHAFHMFFTAIIIPNNFTKNKQLAFQLNPTWISQRSSANMSDPKVTWPLPQVFSPPQICPIFRVLSISRTSPCTNDSSLARNNLWKMFKRRKNDPEICNNNKKRVDWHREWGYHNHKCTLDCIYSHHFVL